MGKVWRQVVVLLFVASGAMAALPAQPSVPLVEEFSREVSRRLQIPEDEQAAYALRLQAALEGAPLRLRSEQFVLLVDRNPRVQAAFLYWGASGRGWSLVGASPVSTGLPGQYEHFTTPLGVFDHSLANPDFRAEGTRNELGFRGYGIKGMRVYDFGWIPSPRGWGDGAMGVMRLQMHATDPDLAEQFLGIAKSAGCVRIPATLNAFMDRHAVLDGDYERAVAMGDPPWVLRPDRTPTATPGRYMVVIDSGRKVRPPWSPLPGTKAGAPDK
ncbi:MAG: L,D-transpeptidase [Burkholderiales bacterium]|nr:L,D-transpeptidase [Burkholderiales bacterium]